MDLEMLHIVLHVLLQGLIYSFVVLGVYFSSRVIGFDDLTTEGSFGFGGAITALFIVSGICPWVTLSAAMGGGALAGAITGVLHTKMRMNNLISGLVVTTGLFSICLLLAQSNVALPQAHSVFATICPSETIVSGIALLSMILGIVFMALRTLLISEIGLILRALGSNPQMVTTIGKNVEGYKILGLALANSLTALAGALFVQWNGFFSITGSVGTLIIGLAGLILAEMIDSKFGICLIIGSILYQALFAITIELEFPPIWNNLIKATLIVVLMQIKTKKELAIVR